jgi:galactokinase
MPTTKMHAVQNDAQARTELKRLARERGLKVAGGRICRTSSRFCLGVEHGDYNGTELFGVGTDRFIWMAYKPNGTERIRLFSGNFAGDGVVEYRSGRVPAPRATRMAETWARFPWGVDFILRREGLRPIHGFDAVLVGNIPGGGMSRSASLTLNLILAACEVNGIDLGPDRMRIIDLAQAVENDYIGSPCGQLDQIMIYFARAGMGTHYVPATRSIRYVPLGPGAEDLRIVSMDTGTVRPGLEKSTYRIRRAECESLVRMAGRAFGIRSLADARDPSLYRRIMARYGASHPDLCDRLRYIHEAQVRFSRMMKAWRSGDVASVGRVFREDGWGLRDLYRISGPELETMCDIARTVPGVLGERMLGGGDKGAAGALVRAPAVKALRRAVAEGYPRSHPAYAGSWALHECGIVDGVAHMEL